MYVQFTIMKLMSIANQSQWTGTKLDLSEEGDCNAEVGDVFQERQCLSPAIQGLVKEIASSLSLVRVNRVEALRDQVMDGTYQIDTTALAKKLLHQPC